MSDVVYKFQCGRCNESYYGECVRHLNVRIVEDSDISPITKKEFKPKNSRPYTIFQVLFNILTHENKTFLLELK